MEKSDIDIDILSNEFYDILIHDRYKILDFIKKYGDYDLLKLILIKIEEKYCEKYKDYNIIRTLFLGRIGYEYNKQTAFYELPTNNLLKFIDKLCNLLNIQEVEEIMGGTGLLSQCLLESTTLNIHCTDGKRWCETSNNIFFDVEKKYIEEYKEDLCNKLFIISWPHIRNTNLINFFNKVKPKQCIIIIERFNKYINSLNNKLINDYKILNIPVKQLCYKDYFKLNSIFPNNKCRSSVYLYSSISNININNKLTIEYLTHFVGDNIITPQLNEHIKKNYIQDLIADKILPTFLLELDDNDYRKAVFIYGYFIKEHLIVPKYINTINRLTFYYNRKKKKKYPILITTEQKFNDYYNLINTLYSSNGLNKITNLNFLPEWINTIDLIDKYLFVDYSTNLSNKRWKTSYTQFRSKYSYIITRINI
jgi:hypothetical protein